MELPVIITYSNYGYLDFAINLIRNLDNKIKNHKVHFYCLDEEIYNYLMNMHINNLNISFELYKCNVSKNFENYGSQSYNTITHTKISILRDALKKFNFIHFIDCDVVCIKEPSAEHYNKYREYDIVFQHDAGMYSRDKLHAPTLNHIWTCTGNVSMRNTQGTEYILNKIESYQHMYPNKNDQECLYQYFQDIHIIDITTFTHSKLYTYNIDEYTNGYWLNNNIGTLENTYFFHANHVSGKNEKINLLKKAKHYYI